jgi:hypothetical protein
MRISLFIAAVVAATLFVKPAQAVIIINMQETGGDLVVSYSGGLNVDDLVIANTGVSASFIAPNEAVVGFGGGFDQYSSAVSGPDLYGTSAFTTASISNDGDTFVVGGQFNFLRLPENYVSGTEISGSMTFESTDFATLGIDTASAPYVWTLTNSAADTITLQVVPEPTSALFLCGTGALACLRRRRR